MIVASCSVGAPKLAAHGSPRLRIAWARRGAAQDFDNSDPQLPANIIDTTLLSLDLPEHPRLLRERCAQRWRRQRRRPACRRPPQHRRVSSVLKRSGASGSNWVSLASGACSSSAASDADASTMEGSHQLDQRHQAHRVSRLSRRRLPPPPPACLRTHRPPPTLLPPASPLQPAKPILPRYSTRARARSCWRRRALTVPPRQPPRRPAAGAGCCCHRRPWTRISCRPRR